MDSHCHRKAARSPPLEICLSCQAWRHNKSKSRHKTNRETTVYNLRSGNRFGSYFLLNDQTLWLSPPRNAKWDSRWFYTSRPFVITPLKGRGRCILHPVLAAVSGRLGGKCWCTETKTGSLYKRKGQHWDEKKKEINRPVSHWNSSCASYTQTRPYLYLYLPHSDTTSQGYVFLSSCCTDTLLRHEDALKMCSCQTLHFYARRRG